MAIVFLSACASPTPQASELHLGFSPDVQPLNPAIATCIPTTPGLQVTVDTLYPNVVDLEDLDLYFQLGEPDEAATFSAQVAWEDVVAVTASSNASALNAAQVAEVFTGQAAGWTLWVGPAGDEARQAFELDVLHGQVTAGANLAGDPGQLRDAVAASGSAIGVLPAAWVEGGLHATDLGLRLPVLALAAEEPNGAARQLLACLQGVAGQAAIAEDYTPLNTQE